MKTADFLSLLKGIKPTGKGRWQALCPGHNDHEPSLSITEAADGRMLIFCHAGCTPDAIMGAIGLKLRDLFLDGGLSPEAIYQYRNKDGSLAYEKLKYRQPSSKKTFYQRHLTTDGQLVDNLNGIARVPYNYPGVITAYQKGKTIIYAEGEGDAETARVLGFTGTTMGGATDWKDEWKDFFHNARIVQIADNDKPGITLVQKVSKSLCEVCKSVKVIILPEGKDLTEWAAKGHNRANLDKLIAEAPELVKSTTTMRSATEFLSELRNSPEIDFLVDQLLPDTKQAFMLVSGRPEIGKTNISLEMAFRLARGEPWLSFKTKACTVGYLFIEGGPQQIGSRLEKLSVEFNGIPDKLYIESSTPIPLNAKGKARLTELVNGLKVCFVDSLKFLIPGDYMKPADVLNGLNALQDVQSKTGTIFVLIGHIRKPNIRGIIRPDDYWTELKGPTEYLEMATSALLLTRPRHNRDEKGHFTSNQDDRELYFVKARDATRELKPLKLHFDRERLLYLPQLDLWEQEDM